MAGQGQPREMARREAILALHRAGSLDLARGGYERLLAGAPDDADLLGLLGVVAMQQQRQDEAKALLCRSVRAPDPDARIHLRNLNNLFVLYRESGQAQAAAELACGPVPGWPPDRVPDAVERDRVMSLAEALSLAGQSARAAGLMESLLVHPGAGADAHLLAGRLWASCDDAAAALPHLRRAAALAPGDCEVQAMLSVVYDKLDQRSDARKAARRCAMAAPVYLAPARPGQRATILTLNTVPAKIPKAHRDLGRLHFVSNFPAQASELLAGEYRFASVFADLPGPLPELPEADLVYNNLASGEAVSQPGQLESVLALVERIGRPVINPPRAVASMTRQKGAALLRGIPGLRVPRIERYRRDLARFDEVAADVAAKFTYPVILRHPISDSSAKRHNTGNETAIRVADAAAMRAFLERVTWPQFYVIQYVDLRKPDGNYRKVRATFIAGEIIISRCQFGPEWMVGAASTAKLYERFPERAEQMQRIVAEPEAMLGPKLVPVLEAIRDAVPLDLFGLDFDVDDDGNVVMFEAQATMILIPTPDSPDYAIAPKEPGKRILAAFRRLVDEKLGGSD